MKILSARTTITRDVSPSQFVHNMKSIVHNQVYPYIDCIKKEVEGLIVIEASFPVLMVSEFKEFEERGKRRNYTENAKENAKRLVKKFNIIGDIKAQKKCALMSVELIISNNTSLLHVVKDNADARREIYEDIKYWFLVQSEIDNL
jgi:hypothetical protein